MRSDVTGPVNIGSEEMVSIDRLAGMILKIAGKKAVLCHISGAEGVRGRNSDNRLLRQNLGWEPARPLAEGLAHTYAWIREQVDKGKNM
jgi:nucleoside-diphosphate-sugar epimerase